MSYASLRNQSGRFAAALMRRGVAAGDRVAVQVDKSVEAVLLYVACLRMGAVFVPINTANTPNEVDYFLRDAQPRVAVIRPADRALLERYVQAFWDKDIDAIVAMLTRDAVWEMPPYTGWYHGAQSIGRLIDTQCPGGVHDMPMLATSANGQPAFGLYLREPDGTFAAFQLQVLTLADVLAHTRPGSIVLLHPWYKYRKATRAAITPIIAGLRARGYDFVTVSELLDRR